ncbi:MAG: imidazole glycerol phosphate synthase subunit HisH [Candidatus Omnitrophica bacterium]|nr:imidazole glycerol phosphate synthase subunit HisH [Candidatus Omnitrophota bacterium]
MVIVIDYGMGNLASVVNAVWRYTRDVLISSDPDDIIKADKLILPGVGAFEDALREIEARGQRSNILKFAASGRPFLGICLGMQLLFTRSCEGGNHPGLDIIKGDVLPFTPSFGLKIPHMGWNRVSGPGLAECPLFKGVPNNAYMYFVHSYYAVPEDGRFCAGFTDYGGKFCSMVCKENIYAVQFHPEKSQGQGLKIIENFVRL